jgi:hypothetical protein
MMTWDAIALESRKQAGCSNLATGFLAFTKTQATWSHGTP